MMGLFCSCFGAGSHDNGDNDRQRPGDALHNVVNKIFQKGQLDTVTGKNEGVALTAATTAAPGAMLRENQPPPPTQTRLQQSGQQALNLHEAEAETRPDVTPQRKSNVRQDSKPLDKTADKQIAEADPSVVDVSSASDIVKEGFEHFPSSEDEDVCPTCLEDYTNENPRIVTQCNHHYHLACIYEWMERSFGCPVCGEVMLFEQMA